MDHFNPCKNGIIHETLNDRNEEQNREERLDALRNGYEAMGAINLQFAESIPEHDLNQLEQYESNLALGRD